MWEFRRRKKGCSKSSVRMIPRDYPRPPVCCGTRGVCSQRWTFQCYCVSRNHSVWLAKSFSRILHLAAMNLENHIIFHEKKTWIICKASWYILTLQVTQKSGCSSRGGVQGWTWDFHCHVVLNSVSRTWEFESSYGTTTMNGVSM